MMWIDKNRHMLARLAAAVAALAVLLAVISVLIGKNIVVTNAGYLNFATVALLFAIYFRIGSMADAEKK